MASQFSTLMALSAMQTQQSQAAVQSTLVERKRKEEQRRKEQEAREKKQKELETKLRLKHFEDEKREKERMERKQREMAALEAEKEKREAAQRDALRYGPKKAAAANKGGSGVAGYPSVNGQTREELRKSRFPSDDDEDDGGSVLTREEKRQRRLQSDLKFGASRSKRSGQSGGYHKSGKRLPGGALDVMGEGSSQSSGSSQSVKARLAAIPNTLTRLNVIKRDTRTIDEIVRDREREKERRVLNGDQAKDFHDWFGKDKKKEIVLPKKIATSTPNSRSNTPGSQSSASASKSPPNGAAVLSKNTTKTASLSFSKDPTSGKLPPSKPGLKSAASDANLKVPKPKTPSKPKYPSAHNSDSKSPYPAGPSAKKRPRSPSLSSDSSASPPSKRRAPTEEDTYRSEIWKMFGKDRSRYVTDCVDSDDEDMEADASALEREEQRSARIARKEDEAALRDEKFREDEKRRKKTERERR